MPYSEYSRKLSWRSFLSDSEIRKEWRGNSRHVLRCYLRCVRRKLWLLMLLTSGVWTEELFDVMEIDALSKRFDNKWTDYEHQEVIRNVGIAHSLFWQFIPSLVIVAKLGEALNPTPCFVRAARAKIKIDAQERIDKTILTVAEWFVTVAFACRPTPYWLCWFTVVLAVMFLKVVI